MYVICIDPPLSDVPCDDNVLTPHGGRCVGGGLVKVEAGDAIVMPYPAGGEVYSIRGPLFDNTYTLEDPQSRVPTHEELVVKWSSKLQHKEGSLYDESEIVFAKATVNDHQSVQKVTDESKSMTKDETSGVTEVELWIREDI